MVKLHTNLGTIVIELAADKTPETVRNFLEYVESGYYNDTLFHRVINDFMIQGGGFDPNMRQKTTRKPIKNEADIGLKAGLKNECYTVAMARASDPHSATSQFFINVKDNPFLDHSAQNEEGWGYCVFGKVVEGMDVVDKIKVARTITKGWHKDVPLDDVMILKTEIV